MAATTLFQRGSISVIDYRCSMGPADEPFVEQHDGFSVSYVRKGSFGYRSRGRSFELVSGSILAGYPGDEYLCMHDHVHGDECLSFFLAPELVESIGGRKEIWRTGCVPPLSELMVLGELAQSAAEGRSVGLDEVAMWFAGRFVGVAMLAAVLPVPFAVLFLLAPSLTIAYLLCVPLFVATSLWLGPGATTVQDLVLPRMRAVASAAYLLVVTFASPWAPTRSAA